jgi:hypothetical protein
VQGNATSLEAIMKVVRFFCLAAVVLGLICAIPSFAQSITSGDLAGVVTDPTGAVVPNAKVVATNDATGAVHNTTTNGEGFYRFSFLAPGNYAVSASAGGFQPGSLKVAVQVGQTASGNLALAVSGTTTTIEVTALPTQVDDGNISTTFSEQQISLVPNPGNDLSAIAQTSPGVTMNTQGGFGNFSSFGLPGTSNLFTLDGQNDNDPFLNLNNSGATNLLLGSNEIQEATVTNNGYSGQYGQLAGAQVNYVTKSGGNQFHGNGVWYWNGRSMNANDFINNEQGTNRPFDNVNEWAASVGGPIVKDKTFFFWDFEGLRVVLPTANAAFIPTQGFETATIANLTSVAPAEVPFYQQMFSLWNHAPGAAGAVAQPADADCLAVAALAGAPCQAKFQSTAGNFTHEFLMALRIDHKFSENDNIFGRVQTDRGLQATFTDVINPVFNTASTQPEYQGQLGWTHIVNSSQVNEFKASGQWYSAIFAPPSVAAAQAAFPTNLQLGDGEFSALGGSIPAASVIAGQALFPSPQGRNVTQYQLVDDYSWTRGNHTWKFGANFHRSLVTDFDPEENTEGFVTINNVSSFFNGGSATNGSNGTPNCIGPIATRVVCDTLQQNFPSRIEQPIQVYGLGTYFQDEWRATKKLKVTLALRLDHNSDPVCATDCFSRLSSPFTTLDHTNAAAVPYNQTIQTGFSQAYPGTDIVVWQPRLGFAYSPFNNSKTVVRGGVGIFSDSFPAIIADTLLFNAPTLSIFKVTNASPVPGAAGSLFANAAGANTAFQQGFAAGDSLNQIQALDPSFAVPNFTTTDPRIRQPRYQEWNLEVQRELPWNTVLSVNYVGNHGIYEGVQSAGLNAFNPNFGVVTPTGPAPLSNFTGVPTVAPDARFGTVTQVQSIGVSNYNGLVTSLRHQFNRGFAFQVNYVWSHSLDDISNGGLLPFNNATDVSPTVPFNSANLRANYGNSDYDVRHYMSVNYVWENSLRHLLHWGPNAIFGGWTFSGTAFYRTGLPFTVVDGLAGGSLANVPAAPTFQFPATVAGSTFTGTACGGDATITPCVNGGGFLAPGLETGFGNQGRNSFRGPNYFDTDLSVLKYTNVIGERAKLGIGVQFFNLLNHPNFDQPINDINRGGAFGTIVKAVNTPTSILGSFLGGDASPRLIQLKAELKF